MPKRTPLEIKWPHWRSRWLVLPSWTALHRVATIAWDNEDYAEDNTRMIEGMGTTLCGKQGRLRMPGLLARMSLKRCTRCCILMDIPQGDGAPRNRFIFEPGDLEAIRLEKDMEAMG